MGTDAGPVDAGSTGGETVVYVMQLLQTPTAAGMTIWGFNLDGRVSDSTDNLGCFKPDYTSPVPDSETGVDNQLGQQRRRRRGDGDDTHRDRRREPDGDTQISPSDR